MYNPTSIGECRNKLNSATMLTDNNSTPSKAIYHLHHLSQTHMNLMLPFIRLNSSQVCILLSDRSLESMLQALYMKEHHCLFPPHALTIEELIQLTAAKGSVPDLDTVMLISSIHFLADLEEISLIQQIVPAQLNKLMKRVDDILIRLSRKVMTHPSEQYQSILESIGI
ncbi:hypothetical protein [Paenibacillus pini]|nr:hypothetical protein [Paenibacillus pini]